MSNKGGKGNGGPAPLKHAKVKKAKEDSKKDSKKNGKIETSKSNKKKTPVKHIAGKSAKDSLKGKEKSKKQDKSGREKPKPESVADLPKVTPKEKAPQEVASEDNNSTPAAGSEPPKEDPTLTEQASEKQAVNESKQSSSVKQSSSGSKPAIKQGSKSSKSKEKSKTEGESDVTEKDSSADKKTTEGSTTSDSPAENPASSVDDSNKSNVQGSDKSENEAKVNAEGESGPDNEVSKNADETPPPDQSEQLESTKPTINQMMKNKKADKPLVTTERIGKAEFESLNDEINELNSGVQMLKHSYGSIIKSLVKMQNTRRAKKRSPQQPPAPGKMNFLTTISALDPKSMKESILVSTDKYAMDNFLNPLTREQTFQQLFAEVDDLNKKTEKLRTFFDQRGNFLRDKYDAADYHVDRAVFNELKLWTKKLITVVDEIARNYNDDLLDLFRLS